MNETITNRLRHGVCGMRQLLSDFYSHAVLDRSRHAVGMALLFFGLGSVSVRAQLSSNPDKFLGNITTSYQMDYGSEKFYQLWNQVTPENETKWSSIQGGGRGQFNWGGADNAANYAKAHNFPFKFHTLIWGAQYPNWVNNLSTEEQYKAIVEWMDGVKKHYPDLEIIDVVNEAVPGHQPAPYKAALGGDGKTGYDWIIKAFEMAYERWPNAILVYNDYNTFQWQRSQFIDLVRVLRDAGAPVDAYGCQSHDLTDMEVGDFKSAMTEIQNALKIPMYSTEYDIGTSDDNKQLQRYREQIPYMWEADYCAGVTIWGYIYGRTWTTDGNSGLIRDGKDRPAMTWLRQYMQTDAAKNAKSPFPGMKKEFSVYVKPQSLAVNKGETMNITIDAKTRTKTIDHIDLYVKGVLYETLTEAPYVAKYIPETAGKYSLKAVVVTTDGTTWERLSSFTAHNPRNPYKGEMTELPGTLQAENFDSGGEGYTFHDSDSRNEGTSYRTDGGGVDIVTGNGGYALGYTSAGEWLEYTVDVKKAGLYSYDAYVSSGTTGSSISLSVEDEDGVRNFSNVIPVPQTGSNNWDKYVAVHGRGLVTLKEGKQIVRLNITGSSCNVDKIVFKHLDINNNLSLAVKANPAPATINESTTLSVTTTATNVQSVLFYVDDVLLKEVKDAPYEAVYLPKAKGTVNVKAEAIDSDGKISKVYAYNLKVNNKRTPYSSKPMEIPGIVKAVNFDKGGEGLTFHDNNSEAQGDGTSYRSDAEGMDIVKGNNSYVLGYTEVNEWTEYSVNITQAGTYEYVATVSSGVTGSGFRMSLVEDGKLTTLATVSVPQTASNNWDTYTTVKGKILKELYEVQQIIRFTITGANVNIDKVQFNLVTPNAISEVETSASAEEEAIYNLAGQRVDQSYKGIVIYKGKKILKK